METGQLKKIIERTVHKHWTGTIEDRNIEILIVDYMNLMFSICTIK